MQRYSRSMMTFLVACFVVLSISWAQAEQERVLRHSDVVFMYDNPELYGDYGCTVVGWAGSGDVKRIEQAHAAGVRLYSTSIGFRTEFARVVDFTPEFLDAACRNFAGEPFAVPWLWDHKHRGVPSYWACTNSPTYRAYLDARLLKSMQARPDGLHLDDYTGTAGAVTWLSACFCKHCLAGFRQYLGDNVPRQKLADLGVTDLAKFDYRRFLLDRGVKPEEYNKRRASLPLAAEFQDFQVKAANGFVKRFLRQAAEYRGKPVPLCVNSGLSGPESLIIAPTVGYFCCEVDHRVAYEMPPLHPLYIYRLAEGLERPVASTAGGWDWAYVKEHHLPGMVRTWIATSYAFGQNFMAPHHQWCYTKEKGTHWYDGPTAEYAPLYKFVRQNERLLDGCRGVAPVAVVYANAARRRHQADVEPISTALAQQNVPFEVAVAGDDWLDYRLDETRLAGSKAVVVPKGLTLDAAQQAVLDRIAASGRLVTWPDKAALDRLVHAPIAIDGTEGVLAAPRRRPGEALAPLVIHLVNRRYQREGDKMLAHGPFRVRVRQDLTLGAKYAKAQWHVPGQEPKTLPLDSDGTAWSVAVPALDLWGILTLAP